MYSFVVVFIRCPSEWYAFSNATRAWVFFWKQTTGTVYSEAQYPTQCDLGTMCRLECGNHVSFVAYTSFKSKRRTRSAGYPLQNMLHRARRISGCKLRLNWTECWYYRSFMYVWMKIFCYVQFKFSLQRWKYNWLLVYTHVEWTSKWTPSTHATTTLLIF